MKLADLLDEFNVVIDTAEGLNELRSLILGLAVRGKLVLQDPNDETASELLKKIEAERQRLYKEGEIRKPTKFDSISKDEHLFKIPKNWEWVKTGIIGEWGAGSTPLRSNPEYWDTGFMPWLKIGDLTDGIVSGYEETVSEKALKECSLRINEPGDILLAMYGSIGKLGLLSIKATTNQAICACTTFKGVYNKYLYFWLKASRNYLISKGAGGVQTNISRTKIINSIFALPPTNEQFRIVERIESLYSEVDELEEKLTRQTKLDEKLQLAVNSEVQQAPDAQASKSAWNFITSNFGTLYHTPEAIDNLKKNILNEAVRGRLVPQNPNDEPASELLKKIEAEKERLYEEGEIRKPKDLPPVKEDEIPFEIPESWEWVRLPDVGVLGRGKSKHRPRNDPKLFKNGTYPLIQTGDVSGADVYIETFTSKYNEVGLEQSKLWKSGTLCITIAANIADTGILTFPACFPDSIVGFQVYFDSCKTRFFDFFMQVLKENLEEMAPSTAQKNINLTILESLAVPFPPAEEQHCIVQRIEELFAICDRFKTQLEQRQAVNERLVKGLVGEVLEGS